MQLHNRLQPAAPLAHTIMSTTICSAGCSHCPFSAPSMDKLSLPVETIAKILAHRAGSLVVLSGGEPFEHPELRSVLKLLACHPGRYRIATGAFVPLAPWREELLCLRRENPGFEGISLGTDVLTSRCRDPKLPIIWKENLRFLTAARLAYSITLTLGDSLDPALVKEWKAWGANPDFFYVRHRGLGLERIGEWTSALREEFPRASLLVDRLA
jgi:hypothetical protein